MAMRPRVPLNLIALNASPLHTSMSEQAILHASTLVAR
jgi:hypothetical protein